MTTRFAALQGLNHTATRFGAAYSKRVIAPNVSRTMQVWKRSSVVYFNVRSEDERTVSHNPEHDQNLKTDQHLKSCPAHVGGYVTGAREVTDHVLVYLSHYISRGSRDGPYTVHCETLNSLCSSPFGAFLSFSAFVILPVRRQCH